MSPKETETKTQEPERQNSENSKNCQNFKTIDDWVKKSGICSHLPSSENVNELTQQNLTSSDSSLGTATDYREYIEPDELKDAVIVYSIQKMGK